MANYMEKAAGGGGLGITTFANTNIIGDRDKWDRIVEGGSGMKNLFLLPTVNIGLNRRL
jgi:hypothetical protein